MSKCLPFLDQMPPEIMGKIVGYTGNIDKLRLRKCCKYLKKIVDNSEIVFERLFFNWKYSEKSACVRIFVRGRRGNFYIEFTKIRRNPIVNAMAALKFVENVFKSHPKIRLVELELKVEFTTEELKRCSLHRARVMEEVSRVFSGLDNKLPVESLEIPTIRDDELLMSVLPHLAPGTLRRLILRNSWIPDTRIDLSRAVETEQWKQAKVFDVDYLSINVEETDHFEIMEYRVDRLEMEDVKRIVENILRENGWKRRYISADENNKNAVRQYLSQFNPQVDRMNARLQTIRRDGHGCKIEYYRRFPRCIKFEKI